MVASSTLNTAVAMPIDSASVAIATTARPGARRIWRSAKRKSCINLFIEILRCSHRDYNVRRVTPVFGQTFAAVGSTQAHIQSPVILACTQGLYVFRIPATAPCIFVIVPVSIRATDAPANISSTVRRKLLLTVEWLFIVPPLPPAGGSVLLLQQPCRRTDAPAARRARQISDRVSPCRSSRPPRAIHATGPLRLRHFSNPGFQSARRPAGSTANLPAHAPQPHAAAGRPRAVPDSAACGAPYSRAPATPARVACAPPPACPRDTSAAVRHSPPRSGRRSG